MLRPSLPGRTIQANSPTVVSTPVAKSRQTPWKSPQLLILKGSCLVLHSIHKISSGIHSMLPFKLVYHPRYDLNLGAHVFPSQKFRLLYELLLREKIATPDDIVEPDRVSDEDLLRVHTQQWITKLKTGTLTASEVMKLEVPYSPELAQAVWLAAGGTILAGQLALRDGFASNLTGGFNHAYADHGEGFCAINDVAIAIRRLQRDKLIKKAIVVDTDVHHGNGTAHIFRNDQSVFTLSIHQQHNYPADKPPDPATFQSRRHWRAATHAA